MVIFPAEVLITLYGLLGDARDLLAAISILTQVLVVGALILIGFALAAIPSLLVYRKPVSVALRS